MTDRTIAWTTLSVMALVLLSWASPDTFVVIAATSLAWVTVIWLVFYRKPRKEKHGDTTLLR